MTNPTEAGARNVRALKDTLYAGFTSCVDLGGYAPELQKVIDEGLILGPTLYGAGAAISMTAGHGEVFECDVDVDGLGWTQLIFITEYRMGALVRNSASTLQALTPAQPLYSLPMA